MTHVRGHRGTREDRYRRQTQKAVEKLTRRGALGNQYKLDMSIRQNPADRALVQRGGSPIIRPPVRGEDTADRALLSRRGSPIVQAQPAGRSVTLPPMSFRGYGQQNRADSSYTREPTGEGWGYGMGGGVPGRGLFPALSGKSPLELIDPGGAAMEEAYRISRPPAWSPADQWAAPLFSAIAGVVNPFDMLGPFDEGIRSTKALKALIETRAAGKLTQKGKDALKSFHAWLRKNNIKVPGKDLNAEAYLVQLERNKAAAAEAREAYWKKIDDAARTREYERSGISDFGPPQPEQGFLEPGSRGFEMDRWDDPSVWVDTSGNVHSRALRNVADEVPRSWFDEGLDYSSDNPWWLKEDALPSDW